MSTDAPNLVIALGSVSIPQQDITEATVHLGATKEVSSWELLLQNWDSKYSPNGICPLNIGQDGYISIGRGTNAPQLITTRTESIKFESTPTEHYIKIAGRCWGEKLFRHNLTQDYSGYKGEAIIKDLLDYHAGISHIRNGTELIEDTDTTFTDLKVQDTQTWDLLQKIATESDKNGTIGYDFRTTPDGKFEFFPRGTKTNPLDLTDKIEHSQYSKEIIGVRNKITIYGVADKSTPLNKIDWTESLTPTDGNWTAISGTISLETAFSLEGTSCIKTTATNNYYGSCLLTLNANKLVNANLYPELTFATQKETAFEDQLQIWLYDTNYHTATCQCVTQPTENIGAPDQWNIIQLKVGSANTDQWITTEFDWTQIQAISIHNNFKDETGTGSFWISKLFFGKKRYSNTQQDLTSQQLYGTREHTDTDEELYSDTECMLRAKAILASTKDPAEHLTIKSTVINYQNTPPLAGDTIHITLPNEGINTNFTILSAEYKFQSTNQTLEITLELGHEKPQLADYIYHLKTQTSKLNRYKTSKT